MRNRPWLPSHSPAWRIRRRFEWSQTATMLVQVACLVTVIEFDPRDWWMVIVIGITIAANIGAGFWFSRSRGRRARPHLFDPDRWSMTSAVIGLDPVLLPIEGGDGTVTGRSMATCETCGMGEPWRAHQGRAWRFGHPLQPWRCPGPEGLARWAGWQSPLPPVWLWHAFFDGTRLCRCAHSAEYRDLARREGR